MKQFICRTEDQVGDNNSSTFELTTYSTFALDGAWRPKLGLFFKGEKMSILCQWGLINIPRKV